MSTDVEYIIQPKNGLITFGPDVIEGLRKEFNMHKKEDRDKAINIIYEWIETQDHIIKKDFSKGYIERCIITSKGSIERAKKQIDRICTMKTLMPKYFQTVNLKESDIMQMLDKVYFNILPRLTKENYRIMIAKVKPNAEMTSYDCTLFFKFLAITAEYLKHHDFCRGYMLLGDIYEANAVEVLTKINLVELQQFIPVITEGYGCKIKGIFLVTASKFIETFIKLVKPLFSEKIGERIHAVVKKDLVQSLIDGDVLPKEYGGTEKSVEQLHDDLIDTLSSEYMQDILKEMNKAVTDESKRRIDKFNDQYMGMPGSFRTLSLD